MRFSNENRAISLPADNPIALPVLHPFGYVSADIRAKRKSRFCGGVGNYTGMVTNLL